MKFTYTQSGNVFSYDTMEELAQATVQLDPDSGLSTGYGITEDDGSCREMDSDELAELASLEEFYTEN